jgi:hypothetical protein
MKRTIIFSALIALCLMTTTTFGQTSEQRLTFSESTNPSTGRTVFKMSYVAPYNPNLRLYEAVALGPVETCFENREFSRPRGVDQDKTLWQWRTSSGSYEITWQPKQDDKNLCRVLIGDSDSVVDGSDFVIWQRQHSAAGLSIAETDQDEGLETLMIDGSVRQVSYSITVNNWR